MTVTGGLLAATLLAPVATVALLALQSPEPRAVRGGEKLE